MTEVPRRGGLSRLGRFVLAFLAAALGSFGVSSVFTAMVERQGTRPRSSEPLVELTEETVEAAIWGRRFPVQYETFRRAAEPWPSSPPVPGPHRDVSCLDCHDPRSQALRVTRRAFIEGMRQVRAEAGKPGYDVNSRASRAEMRTFVCAQCHGGSFRPSEDEQPIPPWTRGLSAEDILAHHDSLGHAGEDRGAAQVDVRQSSFELWSQGVHARAGVSCADCHMPYMVLLGGKVSDHHVRSPLLDLSRTCQVCHRSAEGELVARVRGIQDQTAAQQRRLHRGLLELASTLSVAPTNGGEATVLRDAHRIHREAQFLLAFVRADGSKGFHAPAETSRLLARASELLSRQQVSSTVRKP